MAAQVARLGQRLVDRRDVVAVDDEHARAERRRAGRVGVGVPAQVGRAALAQPVDVDHRDQVGQLVIRRLVQRLPDGALGHLAVAAQHPDAVRQLVEVLPGQRHAHPVGQALPQRPGRHVDPGQHRGGVPLQPGAEPPVAGHQLLIRHHPDRLVDRVQQRRGVALGEDQVVVARVARLVPVIAQVPADQDGQQVGGGHAGGRMAGPGRGTRPDRVHPQLLGEFGGQGKIDVGGWSRHDNLQEARGGGQSGFRDSRTRLVIVKHWRIRGGRPASEVGDASGPGRARACGGGLRWSRLRAALLPGTRRRPGSP